MSTRKRYAGLEDYEEYHTWPKKKKLNAYIQLKQNLKPTGDTSLVIHLEDHNQITPLFLASLHRTLLGK